MLHIAICDDNKILLQELAKHIDAIVHLSKKEYELVKFTSGEQLLNSGFHDIVFLDIEMEGMNGIETAHRLRNRGDNCKLVFLTAYEKYVFSAFDVAATHYLIKPIDVEKLYEVLNGIIHHLHLETQNFITIKQGVSLTKVHFSDILYVEVFGRKLFIHTIHSTYDFYGKLDELETMFSDNFFRCHRSYIVHFSYIRRYDKTSITLENNETIPISKRKYGAFCKCFLAFLKKGGNPL